MPYFFFLAHPAYTQTCDSIKGAIEELDPAVIVADVLLGPGFDACYSLKREFVASSPNALLDLVRNVNDQPWLKGFWHYPKFAVSLLSSFQNVDGGVSSVN